jgi:hypothetical protein
MVFDVKMWGKHGDSGYVQPAPLLLLLIGVQSLLEGNAEFLTYGLELLEVLCVLTFVLDLELDTCDVC